MLTFKEIFWVAVLKVVAQKNQRRAGFLKRTKRDS